MSSLQGTVSSSDIFSRNALPKISWAGLTILPSGVVYAGDSLQPGLNELDNDGGAIFKFIPNNPYVGGVVSPATSPLQDGRIFALTVSCVESTSPLFPLYGQGCEVGSMAFVEVEPLHARKFANDRGATGYYLLKDVDQDPTYNGTGARVCASTYGHASSVNPGEVLCLEDMNPVSSLISYDVRTGHAYQSTDGVDMTTGTVYRFIQGGKRFNSFNGIVFNLITGMVFVSEDTKYGEVSLCMTDGNDDDYESDGCVPFLSVTDPVAVPDGFAIDANGTTAFVAVKHGECPDALKDFQSNPESGCTDDLIKITGIKLPLCHRRGGGRVMYA